MKKEVQTHYNTNNAGIFTQAGNSIPHDLIDRNVDSILKATNLAWGVEQRPIYTKRLNTDMTMHVGTTCTELIPNLVANYRSDNGQFLGTVHPKTYKVVQNVDAFNFIDGISNFTIVKTGEFNGGKEVYITGRVDEQIVLDSSDNIDLYFTFLHGHSGKRGISFFIAPVRFFCLNQMSLLLKTATHKYSITHTGNIENKLIQVQNYIEKSHKYTKELELELNSLINTTVPYTIHKFTDMLIPNDPVDSTLVSKRKTVARATIIDLYENKDDLSNYKGTAFGVLGAVSDYISHKMPDRMTNHAVDNLYIKNVQGNPLLIRAHEILQAM